MKLLKYFTAFMAIGFLLTSCGKEESAGISKIIHFEVKGPQTLLVDLGTSYQEPGWLVTYDGVDISNQVKVDGTVDANTVGLYPLTYWFANKDGVKTSRSRQVIVADPKVKTNIAGTYLSLPGTVRDRGGVLTPYPNFTITVKRIAAGFFQISDFLGGYYDQNVGYGPAYACVGFVQLKPDNTLALLSSSVQGWGDSLSALEDAVYDPSTNTLSWVAVYAGMKFKVKCQLQ